MSELNLHAYVQKYIYPLNLGKTAHDVLQEFIDIDVTSEDLVRILKNNPSYQHYFEKFVNQQAPKSQEEAANETNPADSGKKSVKTTPTHRLIALLGMIGSRNFLLALRLAKATSGNFPISPEGNIDFKPSDYLKLSSEVEDLCLNNNIEYAETWFASAYLVDWLLVIAKQNNNYKKIEPFFQQVWKHSRNTAAVAYALGQKIPNFNFHKYAASAGMLHNVGKILLALETLESTDASYLVNREKADKQNLHFPRECEIVLERSAYGISYEELSSLTVLSFRVFKDLDKSIRYHNEPYYLKTMDKQSYLLACLINLASAMAKSWKTPVDEKDPVLQEWKRPWLKDLKLNTKDVIECMQWAMSLK